MKISTLLYLSIFGLILALQSAQVQAGPNSLVVALNLIRARAHPRNNQPTGSVNTEPSAELLENATDVPSVPIRPAISESTKAFHARIEQHLERNALLDEQKASLRGSRESRVNISN